MPGFPRFGGRRVLSASRGCWLPIRGGLGLGRRLLSGLHSPIPDGFCGRLGDIIGVGFGFLGGIVVGNDILFLRRNDDVRQILLIGGVVLIGVCHRLDYGILCVGHALSLPAVDCGLREHSARQQSQGEHER